MSLEVCPRCHGPLPESVRRDLARGTTCPFCSLSLKEGPRPAAAAARPADGGYASIRVSGTPPPRAPASPPPIARLPPRAPARVAPLVTESDSGPTNVASSLALDPATATRLEFPDSGPIAAVTLTPEPEVPAPPAVILPAPPAVILPAPADPPRRRALLGIGMGLGIVALVGAGVVLLRRPKPRPPAATVAAAPTPASEPAPEPALAPADEPAQPAPKPEATAASAARSPAAAPRAHGARAAHERATTAHRGKGHHKRGSHARKVAMRERTAKHDAAPSPPAEPADARAAYERGNALLFAGDGTGAIAAYREAVKAAPKDPIGFRGLGLAYEHEGEAARAIKSLRRYLKLAPNAADQDLITRRIDRLRTRSR